MNHGVIFPGCQALFRLDVDLADSQVVPARIAEKRGHYSGCADALLQRQGHAWPAGAQDVGAALRWLQANIEGYGGDPASIVPVGQSAGAAHVAGCLAGHGITAGQVPTVAGAALLSGIFEPDAFHVNPMHTVYFGTDRATYFSRSAVLALAATSVPCLFTISEFDPPQFHRQLAAVFAARTALRGRCPEVLHLQGHNHVSSSLQLGSTIDTLGPSLCAFVRRVCGQPMH